MINYSDNQSMQYAYHLLRKVPINSRDFHLMLRDYSMGICGNEISRRQKSSVEVVGAELLKAYTERIKLDLSDNLFKGLVPIDTTYEMMLEQNFGEKKRAPTKLRQEKKLEADQKRINKNLPIIVPSGLLKADDCLTIYRRCRASAVNIYNPGLFTLTNKDKTIPSGKQLIELLDDVRKYAYKNKENVRVKNLTAYRAKGVSKNAKVPSIQSLSSSCDSSVLVSTSSMDPIVVMPF
jgi:hypothetical protein